MPAILDTVTGTITKLLSVIRLKSEEVDTPGGRSRERYRRAALSGIAATAAKGISIGTTLITVPLTLHYLGTERYGMWMTLTSFVLMLGSADLGIGLGLINLIADSIGKENKEEARRAASSAFWMLSAIAFLLLLIATVAYPFVPWGRIFNVHSAAAIREAGPALMILLACFAANLPLGVVNNVQVGLQNGFVNNLWTILGSLFSLGALLLAMHFHAGLPILILALSGGATLAVLFNGIQLFVWKEPGLLPGVRYISRPTTQRLLQTGIMFFLLQFSLSLAYQSDNVVIAQIVGASAVSAYAVPARLFNVVASLLAIVSGAMWPAYADAKARNDWQWIRRSYVRTTLIGTAFSAALTLILVLFGNRILALWVGPQIQASAMLLMVLALRCVLSTYLHPILFLMNGLNELKIQVKFMLTMAVVNLALSILFVKMFGIVGAALGTVVAETLVLVIPLTLFVNRTLGRRAAA